MTEDEEWVIWNGSMGILDMVRIGRVEEAAEGRHACLAAPYDAVGPFSLHELEAQGRIAFGQCLVMSRARWQQDQVDLRRDAQEKRRALLFRMELGFDDREHREVLHLPEEGMLEARQIAAAFRRLAKSAHPDAGGSNEHYRRISDARDALMQQYGRAP